eukprot:4020645-Alexandrium_andersonii.AAC.1
MTAWATSLSLLKADREPVPGGRRLLGELGLGQGVVGLDVRGALELCARGGPREDPRRGEAVPERDGLG